MESDLRVRLAAVHARIDRAADEAGRDPADVALLLATKTQPAATVRAAVAAHRALGTGRRLLLGENRVQELVVKAPDLADLGLAYHLIGPLQSNKVNAALAWANAIDSVESPALAELLARRWAGHRPAWANAIDSVESPALAELPARRWAGHRPAALDVMVQVNVSGEATKHGVAPCRGLALATAVAALPGLRLVGFQTIGAASDDPLVVRAGFAALRAVRDEVTSSGAPGTADAGELSMGMTGDLELAIAEGATIVRVGTAVFGPRG